MKLLMKPLLTVKGLGADLASLSIFIIFILPVLIIFILLGQEVHTHISFCLLICIYMCM